MSLACMTPAIEIWQISLLKHEHVHPLSKIHIHPAAASMQKRTPACTNLQFLQSAALAEA